MPPRDLQRAGAVVADLLEGEVEHVLPARRAPHEPDRAAGVARERRVEVAPGELAHQHLEHVERLHRRRRVVDGRATARGSRCRRRSASRTPGPARSCARRATWTARARAPRSRRVRRGRAAAPGRGRANSPTAGASSITAPAAPRGRAARRGRTRSPRRAAASGTDRGSSLAQSARSGAGARRALGVGLARRTDPLARDGGVERPRPQPVGHPLQEREEQHGGADRADSATPTVMSGERSAAVVDRSAARRARTGTRRGTSRSRAW